MGSGTFKIYSGERSVSSTGRSVSISLQTNLASMGAQRNHASNRRGLSKVMREIVTGNRTHEAAADAAGLAVSENLTSDIDSNKVAWRNVNDGISLIQTAEGGINEVVDTLKRMRELAVQASSETLNDKERAYASDEFIQAQKEIARIRQVTEFNGIKLLDGSQSGGLQTQVGIHNSGNDRIAIQIGDVAATGPISVEILKNGGFDTATGGVPEDWTLTGGSLDLTSLAAGIVEHPGPYPGTGGFAIMQDISLEPNTQYSLTLDVVPSSTIWVGAEFRHSTATPMTVDVDWGDGSTSYKQEFDPGVSTMTFTTLATAPGAIKLSASTSIRALDCVSLTGGDGTDLTDTGALKIDTVENAQAALSVIDAGIDANNQNRSTLGATMNRMQAAMNNLENGQENLSAARSHIRDTDFAMATAEMSKRQILEQSAIAMMGQTNGLNQMALRLI